MIIMGVDFHPEFQQIAMLRPRPESWRSADCVIRVKPRRSIALC